MTSSQFAIELPEFGFLLNDQDENKGNVFSTEDLTGEAKEVKIVERRQFGEDQPCFPLRFMFSNYNFTGIRIGLWIRWTEIITL